MCGRYDNLIARDAYRGSSGAAPAAIEFPARATTSRRPTRFRSSAIDPRDGERELVMARWGLVPWWVEGICRRSRTSTRGPRPSTRKPLFREAFAKRRALIPATGFFEWQKRADGKQPYRFRREDLRAFRLCRPVGVRPDGRRGVLSATIIVGEPNPLAAACTTACR